MRGLQAVATLALVACQASPPASPTPTVSPTTTVAASPSPIVSDTPSAAVEHTPSLTPPPTDGPPTDARSVGWRTDFEQLVSIREDLHPEPWHSISRDEYVAQVDAAIGRIPQQNDDQRFVELLRLAALPNSFGRDGHGGFYPWGEGDFGVNLYPLRLYWFSDGIFVTDALAPHEGLIGARVDAIGGHGIDELLAAIEPLVSRDNDQQVLGTSPLLLVIANVLHGLGFVPESDSPAELSLTRDGETLSADIEPVPMARAGALLGGHYFWTVPPRPTGPLWLSNFDDALWWDVDEHTRTLFVGYNAVGAEVYFAIDDLTAIAESGDVDRIVVDVRHNGGGDNTTYSPLLDLLGTAAQELPHGAYVAMSRATFSAAGNFATEAANTTDAVMVGEDLGTSPNQYGDGRPTTLPHTELVLRVATRWIVKSTDDDRLTIPPDLPAPLSSTDYFADLDPVMEAILDHSAR
jgi:hypothetical protein